MSSEYTVLYEREIETDITVSKKINEEARLKRLERWPREAGLTLTLDESGGNFMQLMKITASEYGLQLGDKKWDIRVENGKLIAKLIWPFTKDGQEVGIGEAFFEIQLSPKAEDDKNFIFQAKVKYRVSISNSVLSEKSTEGIVDLSGF